MQDIDEMELIRIDESTVQDLLKQDEYNGITTDQLMRIWSFTDGWRQRKDKLTMCKMTLPFATSQNMLDFIDRFKTKSSMFKDAADKMTIANLGSTGPSMHFQAEINKAWQAPLIMQTQKIWPYKVNGITFVKAPNGKWAIDIKSPDETVIATMWLLVQAARAVSRDTEFKNSFARLVKDAMEEDANRGNREFKGSIGKAKVSVFRSKMADMYRSMNQYKLNSTPIQSIDDVINADELKNILQTTASTNSTNGPVVNRLQVTGPFGVVKLAFFTILGKDATDKLTPEEEQKFNQICIPISYDNSTPEMKHLAKIVKADVDAGNFQSIDDAIQFMIDNKFGIVLANLKSIGDLTQKTNAENARKRQDGEADVPEDNEVESILNAQSVKQIVDEYGSKEDNTSEEELMQRIADHEWKPPTENEPAPEGRAQPANDLAKRRMKLFEDIQHMADPPKVYQYGHWICAVCYTRAQDYFWTRTKPKVYASGPNQGKIIAYANMRTDELNALVQNGTLTRREANMYIAVRDYGQSSNYSSSAPKLYETVDGQKTQIEYTNVKDGLKIPVRGSESSRTTDDLHGEVYWCTAGALDIRNRCHGWDFENDVPNISYWSSYNRTQNGRNPYWIVMDLNTGILYQHSRHGDDQQMQDECLCEADVATDLNGRYLANSGSFSMAQAFLAEHDYAEMMGDIRRDDQSIKMAELKRNIKVTNDGYVIATTKDELQAIMPLFGQVDGYHKLKLVGKNWSDAFNNKNVQFLTHLDLEGVVDVHNMFYLATISDTLQLENTESIIEAYEMFLEAKNANIIRGINLDSAEHCQYMFSCIKTYHNLDLYLEGNFNIPNCTSIHYMFSKSPVVSITLNNANKVETITSFFAGCNRLKQFPNAYFPLAKTNFRDIFGYSIDQAYENPLRLTWGTTSPFKHDRKKAQEWIQRMFEYYSGSSLNKDNVKTVKKNGKTLAVISNTSMIIPVLNAIADDYAHATGKYDGITFEDITDGRKMFARSNISWNNVRGSGGEPRLLCSTFDFGSLKRGSGMFDEVDINSITEFTGTESIEDASKLFMNAKVSQLPPMSFPNAEYAHGILAFVKTLDKLPIFKFSYKCKTDFAGQAISPGAQLFGEYGTETQVQVERRLSFNRVTSLMRRMQEEIDNSRTEHLATLIKADENGVVVADKQTINDMNTLKIFANLAMAESMKVLKIDCEDATELFKEVEFRWMPVIDMQKVRICSRMFAEAAVDDNVEVKFVNTNAIVDCNCMFENTFIYGNPNWINNMVFQNCKYYNNAYYNAKIFQTLDIDIKFPAAASNANSMFEHLVRANDNVVVNLRRLEFDNTNCTVEFMFRNTRLTMKEDGVLTTNAANGFHMFASASLMDVKSIVLPNMLDCSRMFQSATFCKNYLISVIDIPNVSAANSMFESAMTTTSILIIGQVHAPQLRKANYMFEKSDIGSICFLDMPRIFEDGSETTDMFYNTRLANVYGKNAELLKSANQAFAQLANAAQQETTTAA